MSYKGMVGAMGWTLDDSEIVIKATELFNLVSKETGFMFSEGDNMPTQLKDIQNIITTLRSKYNQDSKMISLKEIEELYNQASEDWHLWDEKESGTYPITRILDAMENFIKTKK